MFTFEVVAGLVVLVLGVLLVAGIVLAITLGKAKLKVWSGRSALQRGQLATAVVVFREAATLTVGTSDFFKLWGGQRDAFDQALEGLATAYQQAGVAVDFRALAELHQRTVRLAQRDGAGLIPGSADELAQWRQQGKNFLARLPQLPSNARPQPGTVGTPIAAATSFNAAPLQSIPSAPLSQQLAPPHWTSPRWFEISLANDLPQRLGFCALIGLATTTFLMGVLLLAIPREDFFRFGIPFCLMAVGAGLVASFVAGQRIVWPGKTEVECQPLGIVRKVSKSMIVFGGTATTWEDTTWHYPNLEVCGLVAPSAGNSFGVLVIYAQGHYDLLGVPGDFPLPNLAHFLQARGVRVQQLPAIKQEWRTTWQTPFKWAASGGAAGAGLLFLLVAMIAAPSKVPDKSAVNPPDVAAAPPPAAAPALPVMPAPPAQIPAPKSPAPVIPPPPSAIPSPPPPTSPPPTITPAATSPSSPAGTFAPHATWTAPVKALSGFALYPDGSGATFYDVNAYVAYAATPHSQVLPFSEKLLAPASPCFPSGGKTLYIKFVLGVAEVEQATGQVLRKFEIEPLATLALSHSGRQLAAVSEKGVMVVDPQQPENQRRFPISGMAATFASFTSRDDEILMWNVQSIRAANCTTGVEREVWAIPPEFHKMRTRPPRISQDGRWLTITVGNKVALLPVDNVAGVRIIELPSPAVTDAIALTGGTQLVFSTEQEVVLWDVAARRRVAQAENLRPKQIQLSANEKFVATCDHMQENPVVQVWKLP